jgi:hypothetical protein
MKPIEIDVFNGDADGLFAAHQLRLAEPGPDPGRVAIVTGLKREIALLERIELPVGRDALPHSPLSPRGRGAGGEGADHQALQLRVFDIALGRNRAALERLLAAGATVRWFDHHHPGTVPEHPRLRTCIDTSPDVCTSLLVDRELRGKHRRWAVAAAFGDNLGAVAHALGASMGLNECELAQLRELGEAVNYNGYGETTDDVLIAPPALYARLAVYADPLDFACDDPIVTDLAACRRTDLATSAQLPPWRESAAGAVFVLPDEGWSRRVLGSFANLLAERSSASAFAVLRAHADGSYMASVRAPVDAPKGADRLCRRFGGDGRAGAGGIDRLPAGELDAFARAFEQHDWGR